MNKRKTILLLTAVILLLAATVGGTVAYLFTSTGSVVNTFEPSKVVPEIKENFNGSVKNNVFIWNSGNVDAYIRAAVVVNWKDEETGALKPIAASDYQMTIPADKGWIEENDGFYYYSTAIKPSQEEPEQAGTEYSTKVLLTNCKLADDVTPPDGYKLHVEVLTQAIQADGMGVDSAVNAFSKAA